MSTLDDRIRGLAMELGVDFYGVADLRPARDEILRQGGEDVAGYPRAVSIGIRLFDGIVDTLPSRELHRAVTVNYLHHCYDVVSARLDEIASRLGGVLQAEGFRALPLPCKEHYDSERMYAQFSHKLAARLAGLGWIGKSCLLVTPEVGPRARWNSVLTDAPLLTTGTLLRERCGECAECVDICPQGAFTGRPFMEGETREARFDVVACERYFTEREKNGERAACGMCVYVCPWGRPSSRRRS